MRREAGCKLIATALAMLLVLGVTATESYSTDATSYARKHLLRGISIECWFQTEDGRSITHSQMRELAKLGFDHVRLPLEPLLLINSPEKTYARLREAIRALNSAGLAVIIDLHPGRTFRNLVRADPEEGMSIVTGTWRDLAANLSAVSDPKLVAFELYNEPEMSGGRWRPYLERLVETVRAVAPKHTLLVGGAWKNSLRVLTRTWPLRDRNVIYVFHYYGPMAFTHQGAWWSAIRRARNVPFPRRSVPPHSSANPSRRIVPTEDMASTSEVRQISEHFAELARWARMHDVPVAMTEFGVIRLAPSRDRARWLRMVRTTAETHGIGWTMWDYASAFGLYDRQKNGALRLNTEVIDALGLRAP